MEEARDQRELEEALLSAERLFFKEYLKDISLKETIETIESTNKCLRLLKLNKFVYNEEEDCVEKLVSVLTALNGLEATYGYVIHSDGNKIEIYLAVKGKDETAIGKDTLENGLKGNFPGIEIENIFNNEVQPLINNKLFNKRFDNLAALVTLPKEKSDKLNVNIQGIEKFVDSMLGEEFTIVALASSINSENLRELRKGYEDIYTLLTPFKSTDFSFNENESENISKSIASGITDTVTNTKTKTTGVSYSESKTNTVGGSVSAGFTLEDVFSTNVTANYSKASTKGKTDTSSNSDSEGTSKSTNKVDTDTTGFTTGMGRTYSFKSENKSVDELLKRIEVALERISQSEDVGLFNFGVYFLSNNKDAVYRAASTYMGLVKGENSGVEKSFINVWEDGNKNVNMVKACIKSFEHPLFKDEENSMVSSTTLINSRELARGTTFPYKSIPGIPAMNFTPFSRNISTYEKETGRKIKLGNIFHMGVEEDSEVKLDLDSLTMHTFITGSTGSGKTNTCCKLIQEVVKNNVKVLIVEPAKGEYKNFFGEKDRFKVYGTNPLVTNMLKVNPFSFPNEIHILEHIDRLIEIFSACWPLYAAMPAILKEAVEESYKRVGWDLKYSISSKNQVFPSFDTLLEVLPKIIAQSAYSQELKSNYIGSLVTRVKSLTNGLIGETLNGQELNSRELFDENVIVDLSRVGSVETKSLMMGIIFLKLYEYNMSKNEFTNKLKHLTVLEEAHNLLRRESASSSEGSNIQGKSVEMISNGIAEMRAFGEGFVIVDQAPGILDQSAIRNTNTKILLRLPDEQDRILVGKSALLTENQIFEMARLRRGVGVVFQNNWLEPVLSKIDRFNGEEKFIYKKNSYKDLNKGKKKLIELLTSKTTGEKIKLTRSESDELETFIENEMKNPIVKEKLKEFVHEVISNKSPELLSKGNNKNLTMIIRNVIDFNIRYEDLERARDLDNMTVDFCIKMDEIYGIEKEISLEILKNILAYGVIVGEDSERIVFDNWIKLYEGRRFM